ncbi:hypothetical protein Syun_019094 [Stephania yunnanensis]|uniref:Uncharacterized protein n=1 Tax=Stephania yunnanensis TaxID=152371 RepID=A0AAP0NVL2_9MAGN
MLVVCLAKSAPRVCTWLAETLSGDVSSQWELATWTRAGGSSANYWESVRVTLDHPVTASELSLPDSPKSVMLAVCLAKSAPRVYTWLVETRFGDVSGQLELATWTCAGGREFALLAGITGSLCNKASRGRSTVSETREEDKAVCDVVLLADATTRD